MAVLDPYIVVGSRESDVEHRILHKNRRMWFAVAVHDFALVIDTVLDGESRRNHLTARAIVVKLTAGQRDYCHRKR